MAQGAIYSDLYETLKVEMNRLLIGLNKIFYLPDLTLLFICLNIVLFIIFPLYLNILYCVCILCLAFVFLVKHFCDV